MIELLQFSTVLSFNRWDLPILSKTVSCKVATFLRINRTQTGIWEKCMLGNIVNLGRNAYK